MNRALRPLVATTAIFALAYLAAILQFPAMLSTRVLGNFLTDNAFLGIAAVGMTFVIISGGIDLSVGAVIGFTTVLNAVLIMWLGLHPLFAFAISLTVAAGFGAVMGAAIHYLKVPSFIVTLAGMFLARGGASVLSPDSIGIKHELYTTISKSYILLPGGGRLTVIGMIMLTVFALGMILAHRTRFGSYVYALGGSEVSAGLMGVPVARTTILIYTLSGFLAGLAGIVFSLYTSAGYSLSALGVELDAIAAVVIGGTLLTGGYGFIAGTFIGVMLQGLVQTYIVFDGSLSSWWTKIVIGGLLFLFILLQRLVFSAASPRRKVFWKT
ncbi:MAG: galactofuranose ABC transporter, permease protein YjfF [Cypionkella sp.]|uniref:galactofuranose ABC transporter, permease protein YjfF n=1 Tax=Cypionkella sp. TaxID=2811411 RepID=UPI002ABB89C8|nr:galactofuranose ABC transporter, permease protein YjfF [Cypionkella sp.]MDZ4312996.1 galactofuranose ABC transporter, permease protein YjfF [Cypionkella sp.]MDZ4392303.1 galactofuranose ABC transporter, permease protein YjfF [Cypionkella sp.]